jgi:hypothetical protein
LGRTESSGVFGFVGPFKAGRPDRVVKKATASESGRYNDGDSAGPEIKKAPCRRLGEQLNP